ncbi:hypothetical protein BDW59DRAFT_147518 [Aspergillus cavernicola]|uniref:Vacuolar sorting protein Vps3844 C-terminal domain-containing protein n=1 Tax=Aspergillus cavernicola TaxID=176166 RepID=A0ABR4I9X4_9EURO
MRPLFSFLTTLAVITIGTNALEASVFTFGPDIERQNLKSSAITSATLQQLLELRCRASTTSALETSDDNSIEFLSRLAGPPSPLFSASVENEDLDTILVILEGLSDDIDSSLRNGYQSELVISAFPTVPARKTFFDSLLEARSGGLVGQENKRCSFYGNDNAGLEAEKGAKLCLLGSQFSRTLHNELLGQISTTESWVNERKGAGVVRIVFEPLANSKAPTEFTNSLNTLFSELQSLSSTGKRATAVVLPISNATQKSSYSRRAPEVSDVDSLVDSVRGSQSLTFEQRTNVPLVLAPVCYASNSSCNEVTNSCSGHGTCYKKSGSESEAASGDCYACRCYETSVKNGDGTDRKVRWGGSACQKKDISSPFFLVSGVAVAIVVAVTAAISMIYSVGNTELPGVISAGVSTTRAQK